jgi:hypothetical protein
MNAIDQLKSVLCGPDGKCCVTGSDEDRAIIDRALRALAQPPLPVQPQRKPLTEEVLKDEFAKLYISDAAILHLAEHNRDYAVESIGARHRWAAFKSGARAIERAHGIGGDV